DRSHRLPRRLVDLLVCLAARPGETWSREALIEAVWSRKVVNAEVLSRAIAELRGLLGDDARDPRYIETLPKTGYRLLAEVRDGASVADQHPPAAAGAAPAPMTAAWTSPRQAWLAAAGLGLALALLALLFWAGSPPVAPELPATARPSWSAAD